MANSGLSVPVKADVVQAMRDLSTLGRAAQGLGKSVASAFGNNRPMRDWNREMERAERNVQRVTQRLREQQAVLGHHVQQQQTLAALQVRSPAQQLHLNRLPSLVARQQAQIAGSQLRLQQAQAAQAGVQQNRPGALGGLAGGVGVVAGGVWGAAAALAAAAFTRGLSTDTNDQMMVADLLPRLRMGHLAELDPTSAKDLRGARSFGKWGYSGAQAWAAAAQMSTAHRNLDGGLDRDTAAALAMGRLFGVNPEGQAQIMSQAGQMGAFQPGQAHLFARMLAGEIKHTGLSPRVAEIESATLKLLSQQMSTSGRVDPAGVVALQSTVQAGHAPAWTGAAGGDLLSRMQSAITGAAGDAQLASLQAVARDQLGITGFYQLKRLKARGIFGTPGLFEGYIQEAQRLNPGNYGGAIDWLQRNSDITDPEWDELFHGSFKGMAPFTVANAQKNRGRVQGWRQKFNLGDEANQPMRLLGNGLRQAEARQANALADLAGGALDPLTQVLNRLADFLERASGRYGEGKSDEWKLAHGFMPNPMYVQPRRARGGPLPPVPPLAPLNAPPDLDPPPPRGGSGKQRASIDVNHKISIAFAAGPLAPQIHHQFVRAVQDATREIREQALHGGLHHRRDV